MTRVAAVQLAPTVGDLPRNEKIVAEALAAVPSDVDVIVIPELSTSGYVFTDATEARASAVPSTSPLVGSWSTTAARLSGGDGGVVIGGFAELGDDGNVYNSAALVDSSGVIGVYRKVHLWDREKHCFTAGSNQPLVVDTRHGRIAVMICFDMEFPEWTRLAALDGAELVAVPTNWPLVERPTGERPPEVQIAIAAARVNRIAFACADRTGTERGVDWNEGTSIIDPDGRVRDEVGAGSGFIVADLDLAATRDKSATSLVDLIADRRPELYGSLVAPNAPVPERAS